MGPEGHRLETGARRALLGAALLFGVLACALHERRVAVHEWWAGRGPVVPHDTFPADCGLCHAGGDWRELRADFSFDHELETGVALEGAHASAECLRCHNDRGPVAMFASKGCAGCHDDVHSGRLGRGCEDCHTPRDWRPKEIIAQHGRAGFPLIGAHASAECWRCHPNAEQSDFLRTDTDCISCHTDDLARAIEPDHIAQGWVDDCQRCHRPTSWQDAGFDHTRFPLTGRHRRVDCLECHVGGVFAGTPDQCVDCHLDDYQAATDPNHIAAGFPTDCTQCHDTNGWGGDFDHGFYPLVGRHATTDCLECHVGGVYMGTPNQCVDCHLDDYVATNDPDHAAAGFPTSCEQCHDPSGWNTRFDHGFYPLVGRHATTDCLECHVGGVYMGTPDQCVDCHLDDYMATNDPDHAAAGFPTTCDTCHDPSGWDGANFDHSFPIDSGRHSHFDCIECHTVPNNFGVFSCIDCHEHSQSNAGSHHSGVSGYVWESNACYSCHPTGNG